MLVFCIYAGLLIPTLGIEVCWCMSPLFESFDNQQFPSTNIIMLSPILITMIKLINNQWIYHMLYQRLLLSTVDGHGNDHISHNAGNI